MGTGRQYDEEFKKQAILLAKEIGNAAAAKELGIPKGTLGTWIRRNRYRLGDTYARRIYESCTATASSQ